MCVISGLAAKKSWSKIHHQILYFLADFQFWRLWMAVKLFRIKISNWIFSNTEDFQIFYGLQLWYDWYHMSLELWIPQKSNINDFQWVKTAHYCLKSMNLVVFQVYFHWCVNVSIFLVIRKPDFGACIILY